MNRQATIGVAALAIGVVALVALVLASRGSDGVVVSGARLSLKQDTYDFGKIRAPERLVKEIEFSNTGTEPLVIKDILPIPPPEGG
jgi:hypothetical protein